LRRRPPQSSERTHLGMASHHRKTVIVARVGRTTTFIAATRASNGAEYAQPAWGTDISSRRAPSPSRLLGAPRSASVCDPTELLVLGLRVQAPKRDRWTGPPPFIELPGAAEPVQGKPHLDPLSTARPPPRLGRRAVSRTGLNRGLSRTEGCLNRSLKEARSAEGASCHRDECPSPRGFSGFFAAGSEVMANWQPGRGTHQVHPATERSGTRPSPSRTAPCCSGRDKASVPVDPSPRPPRGARRSIGPLAPSPRCHRL
jgi:hypothetical protein